MSEQIQIQRKPVKRKTPQIDSPTVNVKITRTWFQKEES